MDEFSIIFSSPLAMEVFHLGSIVFMLAYLTGFLILHQWSQTPGRRSVFRHAIPAFGAALIAAGYGIGLHWATMKDASAAAPAGVTASVSPEQIHRATDARTLPVLDVRDPF